jgi:hypothetical protein
MADLTRARLILIVTGSSLRAEEADRPLAYYMKQQVEKAAADLIAEAGPTHVCVVADFRWLHEETLQRLPTISLGGPGVNALAHRWLEDVPVSLAVDEQYYIQMDPDLDESRASIWGMDNTNTQIAVSVFLQRFLPRFLEHCATIEPPEIEADSEADPDSENDED